jgi:hypothetical protein
MSMVFCRGCAKEIHESAQSCPGCGAPQGLVKLQSMQPGSSGSAPEVISESWLEKFALIEKAGGVKMPGIKSLPVSERIKVSFNVWGFLFGPIYYFAKGMWKKSLPLLGIAIVLVVILEAIFRKFGFPESLTNFVASAIFAARANIDYYKKIKLDDDGWW